MIIVKEKRVENSQAQPRNRQKTRISSQEIENNSGNRYLKRSTRWPEVSHTVVVGGVVEESFVGETENRSVMEAQRKRVVWRRMEKKRVFWEDMEI